MIFNRNKLSTAIAICLPACLLSNAVIAGYSDEVANNGGSKSAVEFAQYAETVTNTELQTLLSSVSGDSAVELANDMLADSNGAALNASLQNALLMQDVLLTRATTMRRQDSLGTFNFGWNTWATAIGSYVEGDSGYDISGYETTTYGVMFGADKYVIADRAFIGYALGYANNTSDADDNLSEVTSDNYQFLSYAGWAQDSRFLDVIFNIGTNKVDSSRTIRADNNADVVANYDQFNMGYRVNAGQTFEALGVSVEPTIGYEAQWISQEDYEEAGSVAALRFDRETYHIQYANIGLALSKVIELESMVLTPHLKITYASDLNGGERVHDSFQLAVDSPSNKANFYDKTGAIVGGDKLQVQGSLSAEITESVTLDSTISFVDAEEYQQMNLFVSAVKRF